MERINNNSRRDFLKTSSMLGLGAAFTGGMIGSHALSRTQQLEPKRRHTCPQFIYTRQLHSRLSST